MHELTSAFETVLFLGFPLLDTLKGELLSLSAAERDIFIQNRPSPYLQQIESEGCAYLGKCIGHSIEMNTIDNLYLHITSLLKKLVPAYHFEKDSLVLLALPAETLNQ